jgi:hypothetical protein
MLLHVAWLSVLLGLVMQALLMLVALGLTDVKSARPFIADLVQRVSWATMVCVGIAAGSIVSRVRAPAMGLAGLLAAPISFTVARMLQRSVAQALGIMGGAAGGLMVVLLAGIKGAEYGCLGWMIGWIQQRGSAGVRGHVRAGLVVAVIFGSATLAVMVWLAAKPIPPPELLSRGINELLFPVGCSLVLYAAEVLGRQELARESSTEGISL